MEQSIKVVPVMLGGQERHLKFDVNALISLGDELNLNFLTKDAWDSLTKPDFRQIRAIVWAGLLHEAPELTVREVGSMMDPQNLQPVIDAYQQAFAASEETLPKALAAAD